MSLLQTWLGWQGWGDPRWLTGLWALPLVIVFYLLRRRAIRQEVPFLPFWDRVFAARRRKPSPWRTVISVLLQLLIATSIIGALAGPYREGEVRTPLRTQLILDRSAGCALRAERPLADDVAAVAARLWPVLHRDGPVTVLVAYGRLDRLSPDPADGEAVLAAMAAEGPPAGERADALIEALAREAGPDQRVVYVTPFEPQFSAGVPPRLQIVPASEATLPRNGGIRGVHLAAGARALSVLVDPAGAARTLRLLQGGVVAGEVAVLAGERRTVELSAPMGRGPAELRLDPPDAWPDDDRADLVLAAPSRLAVLVAADRPLPLLDAALVSSGVVDTARSGHAPLARALDLALNFDVTILVEAQGDLALRPGNWILVDSTAPELPLERSPALGEARATRRASDVPWLMALDPEEWKIHRMASWKRLEGADVLVEGSRGPLVTRFASGRVHGVAFSVTPDLAASTLPLLPAFPLMLRGALLELTAREAAPVPVVRVSERLAIADDEALAATTLAGDPAPLRRAADGGGRLAPQVPGRYRVGAGEIAVAWLDSPATAPRERASATPPIEPTRHVERRSERPLILLILLGLLALEWITYCAGATD